jgi:protein SCO1/2
MNQSNKQTSLLLILILAIGSLLFFYYSSDGSLKIKKLKKQIEPTLSLYPSAKPLTGQLSLLNDTNQTLSLSEVVNNKWSLLYFGYTSCPDVCPTDLAILSQTISNMQHADQLQIVFISVDPERDIGKLNAFVGRFNQDFVGVSASKQALTELTKQLGVYHEVAQTQKRSLQSHDMHSMDKSEGHDMHRMAKKDRNYLINHTSSYILLDPTLKLTGLLTNPHQAKKMATALDLTINALN